MLILWYYQVMLYMNAPKQVIDDLLDEEIRQLTELKSMAANPRLLDMMRKIVAASTESTPVRQQQPNLPGVTPGKPQDVAEPVSYLPNGLTPATLEAMRTMGRPFTIPDIVDKLNRSGFKFVASKPKVAVAAPLKAFLKRGEVKMVKRGFGSEPNVYEFVGGNADAAPSV